MFSLEHLLVILFFIFLGYFLVKLAKAQSIKTQDKVGVYITNMIALTIIFWTLIKIWLGKFTVEEDLPFHLCNFVGLASALLARTKKYLVFEIIFFWIIAGTLQGIITPDLYNSFPNYNFFKFWIVHAGLVMYMMYVVFVQKMRPNFYSIFKSVGALLAFAVFIYGINYLLNANYMYLHHKPIGGSLLDSFGEWPYYIFVCILVIIPFFVLIYLPFFISDRIRKTS